MSVRRMNAKDDLLAIAFSRGSAAGRSDLGRGKTRALVAPDRDRALHFDSAEKLQQALDVMRAGIRLKRSGLCVDSHLRRMRPKNEAQKRPRPVRAL